MNSKSLYIFSESLPITSYKSSRDSLADNCSLTPQQKQEFLLPGQKLEQEFLLPGQKLEPSDSATTSTKLEDRFEPIARLKEFFDKYLKRHSNKSTTQVSTQASKPEPIEKKQEFMELLIAKCKSETSSSSTEQAVTQASSNQASKPEPIDPMAEFIDSCLAKEQAATQANLNQASKPEPIDPMAEFIDSCLANEQASTPTQARKPSPKLLLPESIQGRRDHLDNIYNKLASSVRKEFPFNPIEDIDVGVAVTATLDGYSDYDIGLILLRSPKSYDLRQKYGFDNMSDYIDQRKAITSEEMQLYKNPKLRGRVDILKPIIDIATAKAVEP